MIGNVLIRTIAHRVPRWLRNLRAQALLEHRAQFMGIQEVDCPACLGGGWLNRARWEPCPLCRGFRELPRSLATWFERQVTSEGARRHLRAVAFSRARYGRMVDHPHRMADLEEGSYDDLPRDQAI